MFGQPFVSCALTVHPKPQQLPERIPKQAWTSSTKTVRQQVLNPSKMALLVTWRSCHSSSFVLSSNNSHNPAPIPSVTLPLHLGYLCPSSETNLSRACRVLPLHAPAAAHSCGKRVSLRADHNKRTASGSQAVPQNHQRWQGTRITETHKAGCQTLPQAHSEERCYRLLDWRARQ